MDKKVCLDMGHGGYDPGAVGPGGTKEKDVTLPIGLKVGAYLQTAGVTMIYTRTGDHVPWPSNLNKDLAARCKIANDSGADVFVSIHANSSINVTAKGNEIYTTPGQGSADALANSIHARVKAAFPGLTYREDIRDGDPDKEANFYVLRNTKMPAVLSELGFISNPAEEKMLASQEFQDKAALAIAQGIGDYLGVDIPVQADIDPEKPLIYVGGTVLEGILINGRTYAPVRALAKALGRTVEWDGQKVTIK